MVKSADFLKIYEVTLKIKQPAGNVMQFKTTVQASTALMAKKLAEAQYGKGSVMSTPREVK
jgi:hypothetical protein